jgi:hypothetical protein
MSRIAIWSRHETVDLTRIQSHFLPNRQSSSPSPEGSPYFVYTSKQAGDIDFRGSFVNSNFTGKFLYAFLISTIFYTFPTDLMLI